jgi:hypothetical protein
MNVNPFAGMNETKASSGGGTYLTDGRYKIKVTKCLYIDTDQGNRAFIAEFAIVETTDAAKHPVGANRSWYQGVNKSFKAEVKSFCYAACGYDAKNDKHAEALRQLDSRSEGIMSKAIGPLNILSGRELNVDVKTKQQKQDKTKSFTGHTFSPASTEIPIETIDKVLALP